MIIINLLKNEKSSKNLLNSDTYNTKKKNESKICKKKTDLNLKKKKVKFFDLKKKKKNCFKR